MTQTPDNAPEAVEDLAEYLNLAFGFGAVRDAAVAGAAVA